MLGFMITSLEFTSFATARDYEIRLPQSSCEFRQIKDEPSAACDGCIASDSSESSTSVGAKFEITSTHSIGIISTSAAHCGHQPA
jgi:hypothetical protein